MTAEAVLAADISWAAALSEDARVVGPLDGDAAAAIEPVVNIDAPPGIADVADSSVWTALNRAAISEGPLLRAVGSNGCPLDAGV
jgi:hypothetical protein